MQVIPKFRLIKYSSRINFVAAFVMAALNKRNECLEFLKKSQLQATKNYLHELNELFYYRDTFIEILKNLFTIMETDSESDENLEAIKEEIVKAEKLLEQREQLYNFISDEVSGKTYEKLMEKSGLEEDILKRNLGYLLNQNKITFFGGRYLSATHTQAENELMERITKDLKPDILKQVIEKMKKQLIEDENE